MRLEIGETGRAAWVRCRVGVLAFEFVVHSEGHRKRRAIGKYAWKIDLKGQD